MRTAGLSLLKIALKQGANLQKTLRSQENYRVFRRCILEDEGRAEDATGVNLGREVLYHTRMISRNSIRSQQLAYGFLRGVEYSDMEQNSNDEPNWNQIWQLVRLYGRPDSGQHTSEELGDMKQRFSAFVDTATGRWVSSPNRPRWGWTS